MTQNIIVALIVGLAAVYAVWRWMPAAWRRAAAGHVAGGTQRAGLIDAERAQALAASLARSSGCGACDSCGSCGSAGSNGNGNGNDKRNGEGAGPRTADEATIQPPTPRAR